MKCKNADELLELAKTEGVELTREQAEEYITILGTRELTEEELRQVAGGIPKELMCPHEGSACPDYCKKEVYRSDNEVK